MLDRSGRIGSGRKRQCRGADKMSAGGGAWGLVRGEPSWHIYPYESGYIAGKCEDWRGCIGKRTEEVVCV